MNFNMRIEGSIFDIFDNENGFMIDTGKGDVMITFSKNTDIKVNIENGKIVKILGNAWTKDKVDAIAIVESGYKYTNDLTPWNYTK